MRRLFGYSFLAVFFAFNVWWLTERIDAQEEKRLAEVKAATTGQVVLQALPHTFTQPLLVAHAGDGQKRLFVVEQTGKVRVVRSDGALQTEPFLDVGGRLVSSRGERGLLGLAFHPAFKTNGQVFVHYSAPGPSKGGLGRIARFVVDPKNPNVVDDASHTVVLEVEQPLSNHNGGHLAFGKDGMLYIGLGDGGGANDQLGNSRKKTTLLAKMLRIDVDHPDEGRAYGIPKDNPFVDAAAQKAGVRGEIWAWGLRNPWRFAFDKQGGLFIADVGQNAYEEVNYAPPSSKGGEDYGWNTTEGRHCFQPEKGCVKAGLVMPIAEYTHDDGCSVTGGVVVEHPSLAPWQGQFLFGDFCSGKIWATTSTGQTTLLHPKSGANISSFGAGEDGQVYVTDLRGKVHVLQQNP